MNTPSRGGSVVTSFDAALLRDAPPTELGPIWRRRTVDKPRVFSQADCASC
jgi:hypothetical protein